MRGMRWLSVSSSVCTPSRSDDVRILILEDDPLIALDLQFIIEDEGHEVVGPCASVAEARGHADVGHAGPHIDLALLDVDLPDGKSFDLAARLIRRGIPVSFVSASTRAELPAHLGETAFIAKPYQHAAIRRSLAMARSAAG